MTINVFLQALVIIALIVPILIGFLLGSGRGLRRSIIRLVLVALSIVLAFVLRETITDKVINLEVNGEPLGTLIATELFQGQNIPTELVDNVISLIFVAAIFMISLTLFLFVTWAFIFPICKLFLRKRKTVDDENGGKRKKRRKHNGLSRLLGSILGLAQGVAVAVVCVTVLNGLFFNMANIYTTINEAAGENDPSTVAVVLDDESTGGDDDIEKIEEYFDSIMQYNDSGIRKFISKMGGDKLFDEIVSIKVEDDKKITLTGQIDAFRGLIKMGKELSSIEGLEMKGGLSATTADELVAIFDKLDEVNSSLTEESKDAINKLIQVVAGEFMPSEVLENIDFNTINFANEGQVISKLSGYKQTDFSNLNEDEAKQKATEIVNTVMSSDIILPMLSSNNDFTIGLEGKSQELAKEVINEMAGNPEVNQDKVEMLKNFFGVKDEVAE